jgi:hypothetical protein
MNDPMNSPPCGLRLRPSGPTLRISRSAELTTKPGVVLSELRRSVSKPAGASAMLLRAVMSEDRVFVNNPG